MMANSLVDTPLTRELGKSCTGFRHREASVKCNNSSQTRAGHLDQGISHWTKSASFRVERHLLWVLLKFVYRTLLRCHRTLFRCCCYWFTGSSGVLLLYGVMCVCGTDSCLSVQREVVFTRQIHPKSWYSNLLPSGYHITVQHST